MRLQISSSFTRVQPWIEVLLLLAVVGGTFTWLVMLSPYPVGDDPGFHTTVLQSLLRQRTVDFALPYFPDLGQRWGNQRFVTTVFLGTWTLLTGDRDPFRPNILFAAFTAVASLLPIYLLLKDWLRSFAPSLLGIAYIASAKFFLEPFFEGNYDQYTGLLMVCTLAFTLHRWYQRRDWPWGIASSLLLLGLAVTHELGFLVGAATAISVAILAARHRFGNRGLVLAMLATLLIIGAAVAIHPVYFAPNSTAYPLHRMLGSGEGTPLLAVAVIALGALSLLVRPGPVVPVAFTSVGLLLSQSNLLGTSFYPYRFNVYFIVGAGMLFAAGVSLLIRTLHSLSVRRTLPAAVLALVIVPQAVFSYGIGTWITSQERNPASVILTSDVVAFRWIAANTPPDAVILASYKWGYYLPAVANRTVVLDNAVGGDARDDRYKFAVQGQAIYQDRNAVDAYRIAREINVSYIVWDASIGKFPDRYPGYRESTLRSSPHFRAVYERDGTRIYAVQ